MLVYVRPSNEALSRRAFREHRTNVGALPIIFIVGALRASKDGLAAPFSSFDGG